MSETTQGQPVPIKPHGNRTVFGSNAIQLSLKEWLTVLLLVGCILFVLCRAWPWFEGFRPGVDYRIPYELSNDYWLYSQSAKFAATTDKVVVVGDSVIWGQYVAADGTLSHCLNEAVGKDLFINLGVNGMHPAALLGLIRYYGGDLKNKTILLHCNPLWMTSIEQDLRSDKEFRFNHPKLIPQFRPRIPCYAGSPADRLTIAINRYLPFEGWAAHLRIAYFDNVDPLSWTLEHPYANPLKQISFQLPSAAACREQPVSWEQRRIDQANFEWVAPEESFQWKCFRQLISLLHDRGNRVFVILGSFNEHLLKEPSRERYAALKNKIEKSLKQENVPCYSPRLLPSDTYCDASHPMAAGYAAIAKELYADEGFLQFMRTAIPMK